MKTDIGGVKKRNRGKLKMAKEVGVREKEKRKG
jgi:hypothetical protein